jgi:predicted AlkP superfamily phosphohydrolase/phosphomutase
MRRLIKQQMWDFFISVEIGASRLQQRLWGQDLNRLRSGKDSGGKATFEQVILGYYKHIDSHLEQLVAQLDSDTALIIVSDRGVQSTAGSICVNDWLADEEWLAFVDAPSDSVRPFQADAVDWQKTLAWAEGGEFTRFFLNVEGREQQGVIPWSRYLDMRDELIAKIQEVRGPSGERLNTQIFKPEETFRHLHGTVPDLIVYWDNLRWHSTSDLGHPTIWTNVGEAGAAPTPNGLYIYWHPRQKLNGRELFGWEIMDVAPTILDYFQVQMPIEMQGRKMPLSSHDFAEASTPAMMDLQGQVQPNPAPRRQRRRKMKAAVVRSA